MMVDDLMMVVGFVDFGVLLEHVVSVREVAQAQQYYSTVVTLMEDDVLTVVVDVIHFFLQNVFSVMVVALMV